MQEEWEITYYETPTGRSPVREFIDGLPAKAQAKIAWSLDLLARFGVQLGEPYVKPIARREKLWELRVTISPNIYRLFYFAVSGRKFVLVHAFTKRSQRTPRKELDVAEARRKEYLQRFPQEGSTA